ncbi:hypothetical protein LPJ66_000923 [Kickxella alabastrina]|uniref:Uncharacterized protein n=1 Tax=Kickxella alabastrina TaxID=61397 RepID=A0ACC1IV08_9FUNG|nr:hypothetical protein LPJ66_000923 [Kickxella alabastrina]
MIQVPIGWLLNSNGQLNITAVDFQVNMAKAGMFVDTPGNSAHGHYTWYMLQMLANLTTVMQHALLSSGLYMPALWAMYTVHGASFVKQATIFPSGVGLAATLQPQFACATRCIAAKDTHASGYNFAFAANADLGIDKHFATGFLGFGEDLAISSAMIHNSMHGLQGDYKTDCSCALGTAPFYLHMLLHDSLSFHSIILSKVTGLHSAANSTGAIFLALNMSTDIAAEPSLFATTAQLVHMGAVPEDHITKSVTCILQMKKDIRSFNRLFANLLLSRSVGSMQDVETACSAVRESVTLYWLMAIN